MPPVLGGYITDRLGQRPTDPARRDQWTVLVADADAVQGEVWSIQSNWQCIELPGGNTANGSILTQQGCNYAAAQPWVIQPGILDESFWARSLVDTNKCLSVRDPYNPSDPHWIHIWDCFSNHPAQQWVPVG